MTAMSSCAIRRSGSASTRRLVVDVKRRRLHAVWTQTVKEGDKDVARTLREPQAEVTIST
jgi:hypothetical protein